MKKLILTALCLMLLAGCGQTVVLMPDLDGHVGEVTVTAKSGETVTLNQANQAVRGKDDVYTVSDQELQSTFGEALAAQPEPTARFLLHFFSDSAKLKPESEALIPEIMESYRTRASTDVSVIGHTDTVGEKQYNYDLSVRRATAVKELLEAAGIPAEIIETTSHGEENPLVPTPDGKAEPRNRRVEVLVR
ncbi:MULTISPECIES: OmpA family protein [unclassified Pseudodesulfovibrio]|uniref:OmpA family protein n=1 Tax=unclassified Pseudodesulfovibrio TaxID=2661612 RepID=UPI000FEB7CEA|nr:MULTISPECIES: OmpA family protein [unclassified Pseudodesulfovibrio]MCJ2165406.1 OmpA family protein [Pseudodesulfovibrio sp. S3-i]RWU03160.1 OmpA family protein [Pseudodesulfovibrio sp. S3]